MNSLRSMSISRRLWLILIVAVLMLLTLGLLMLKQIHGDLYQAKRQQTQYVVQTASGVLAYYQNLEKTGVLTREAANSKPSAQSVACATTTMITSGSTT